MSKWVTAKLGDVSTIITGPFGSQLHQSDYVSKGIPIVMPQNIADRKINYDSINYISEEDAQRLKRYTTQTNDILYARRGDVEKHAFITERESGVYCGTGCLRVRITSENIEPLFLSFFLNSEETKRWLVTHAVGSNMPNLNTDILSNVPVSYPTLGTQKKIANTLNYFDQKISVNRKINDNLHSQMCLLYEQLMSKAISKQIQGDFVCAKELTEVITGKEDANFSAPDGLYKFFTCSNTPLQCNEYAFDSSSILIAGNGDFNVKHYSGKFNAYQRTYVLTPPSEYYSLLYMASLYRINSFKSKSSGSIVKFITKGDVENIPLFIPTETSILKELNKLISLKERNSFENEELSRLRDWLLQILMNRQATIED